MNEYALWAARYPEAAAELEAMHQGAPWADPAPVGDKSEGWSQQAARMDIARQGAMSWRNNVGATPAKCPDCGSPRQPIRYGLANDSKRLNDNVKSSDLILAIPRTITRDMVGDTIAQFGAVETKRPGWVYGKGGQAKIKHERGQLAWLSLIRRLGGFATFSTGQVKL